MLAKAMDLTVIPRGNGMYAWSRDGEEWNFPREPMVYDMNVVWSDGQSMQLHKRERAQVLLEDGRPIMVFFATRTPDGDIFNTGFGVAAP
jgi:hypothetical protein